MSSLAYFLPKFFLVIYVWILSGALGFIHADSLLPLSFENLNFLVNLATIVPILVRCGVRSIFSERIVRIYIVLFLFGILYPIFNGWSNLTASVTDGKGFLSILLIPYLLAHRSITPRFIKLIVFSVSYYLGLICIVYLLFGVFPVGYEPVSLSSYEGLHIRYATVMLLAVLLAYIDLREKYSNVRMSSFIMLLLFLWIQPHDSVALASTLVIGAHYLYNLRISRRIKFMDLAFTFSGFMTLLLILSSASLQTGILNIFNQVTLLEGAFGSRLDLNVFRLTYFLDEPMLGYGFIDETSALGAPIKDDAPSRFSATLGVVDAGIVDIGMRFGSIGLSSFVIVIMIALRRYDSDFRIFKLLLASYFLASLTWSVFTYSFGIVIISIAYALCVKVQSSKFKENYNRYM